MKMKIYANNLPKFEEYDIIDLNEDFSFKANELFNKGSDIQKDYGVRVPDRIYIIGRDFKEIVISIDEELFFKDYLKLGKKLFELASKNKIDFEYYYDLNDDYIYSKHVNYDRWFYEDKIRKNEKYNYVLDNVYTILEEASAYLEDTEYETLYQQFIDLVELVLEIIYILYVDFHQNVDDKFDGLNEIMDSISKYYLMRDRNLKTTGLTSINNNLNALLQEIKIEMKNKGLDIRKNTIISNAKNLDNISNIDFLNKFGEYPIKVKFKYGQFKDIKKTIKSWLKLYGFPYYVYKNDEKDYRKEIERLFSQTNNEKQFLLADNEIAIPCDLLIIHSIFTYMLYSIFEDGNKADQKIKECFLFSDEKKKRKNKRNIFSIKKDFNYFNEVVCSNILGFKSFSKENDYYDMEKTEYLASDDFSKKRIDNLTYVGEQFNNLCVAAYKILNDRTSNATPNTVEKQCPICKKWFTPNKMHKTYCSEVCQIIGKRKNNTKNKRKNRQQQKFSSSQD